MNSYLEANTFPEKWAIRRNKDTDKIITDWFQTQGISLCYSNWGYPYANFPKSGVCSSDSLKGGYTEISFEQFQKHILKQEDMKKLIGYKAPKDLFKGNVKAGRIYKEIEGTDDDLNAWSPEGQIVPTAHRLPKEIVETWEPIYEEEFKIGDWIAAEGATGGNSNTFHKLRTVSVDKLYVNWNYGHSWPIDRVRKATKEEIKEQTQITIGGHKAERVNAELIEFGCQGITKSDLESYLKLFNSEIKAELTIRGTKITEETISKLLNLLK